MPVTIRTLVQLKRLKEGLLLGFDCTEVQLKATMDCCAEILLYL